MAVSTATKPRNGHSLIRSARVPETIEAVVATKTIWKNQSDAAAYSPPSSASTVGSPADQMPGVPKKPPELMLYINW